MKKQYRHRGIAISLALLACLPAGAAVSSRTVWEVRTTGSISNGGGFDPVASPGTDYSQQDTARVTFNGTTISATAAAAGATITLSGYTVTAADNGNVLQIAGGTNFTSGFYTIVSVNAAANTWTLSGNAAAGAASAMTGAMGGASTLAKVAAAYAAGNTIYIKTGTYTLTTAIAWATGGTATLPVVIEGYNAIHGDLGTQPTLTNNNASTALFTLNAASYTTFRNLRFTYTGSARGQGIQGVTAGGNVLHISQCTFDGVSIAYDGGSRDYVNLSVIRSVIQNTTSPNGAVITSSGTVTLIAYNFCYNNVGPCLNTMTGTGVWVFTGNVCANNGGCLYDTSTTRPQVWVVASNTMANNTGNAIYSSASLAAGGSMTLALHDNIFWNNSGAAINLPNDTGAAGRAFANAYNAYGNNGAASVNWSAGMNDKSIVSDPFANDSGTSPDYSLNSRADGGGLLRGAGFPGSWGIGTSGHLDIGAIQTGASTGSKQKAWTFVQ